jgi:hypothetical protein
VAATADDAVCVKRPKPGCTTGAGRIGADGDARTTTPIICRRLAGGRCIVAINFAVTLEDEGYEVVGPAHNIGHALEIIERQVELDGALVDLSLRECTL